MVLAMPAKYGFDGDGGTSRQLWREADETISDIAGMPKSKLKL
jgi:hypothetical protein